MRLADPVGRTIRILAPASASSRDARTISPRTVESMNDTRVEIGDNTLVTAHVFERRREIGCRERVELAGREDDRRSIIPFDRDPMHVREVARGRRARRSRRLGNVRSGGRRGRRQCAHGLVERRPERGGAAELDNRQRCCDRRGRLEYERKRVVVARE